MTDLNGWSAFWRMFHAGEWEPKTKRWIEESVGPDDIFLDIGAWIGPTALWAHNCDAYVIAIEPDPVAFGELERGVGQLFEVELHCAALTVESGFANLRPNPREGGRYGDSMSQISDDGHGAAVVACTLHEILEGRRPTAVKIDVEGYEYTLLPAILPDLAEMRCELHVSFHDEGDVPLTWFMAWDWFEQDGLDVTAGFDR